jgi:hypothetical protein
MLTPQISVSAHRFLLGAAKGDSYKRMPEIITLAGATHPSPGTKTKIMGKVFRLFIHLAVKPASVHVGD